MKLFSIKSVLIFPLFFLLAGCEFSLKPPTQFKEFFKTEADSRYYNRKCGNLLEQLNQKLGEYGIRRIAVMDFVDYEGKVSELGRFLSSNLMVQIPKESALIVVQRGQVEKALQELGIPPKEGYELDAMNKLGKKLAVDGIVVGKLVDLGTNIDVNLKMIDVNTGDVIATASESLARTRYAVEMSERHVVAPTASK